MRDNLQQKVVEQCSQGITLDARVYAYSSPGMDNATLTTEIQGMSLEQEAEIALDHALFLWMGGEETMFANGASSLKDPKVQSNYNTCSNQRLTGESTVQQSKIGFDKTLGQPVVTQSFKQPKETASPKPKEKKSLLPMYLNVVEQLKRALANESLWDILAIQEHKSLLREYLEEHDKSILAELATKSTLTKDQGTIVGDQSHQVVMLTNDGDGSLKEKVDKMKPTLFFLTLIVGDMLLHDSMVLVIVLQ